MRLDILHVSRSVSRFLHLRSTLISWVTECQQSSPKPFSCYASAPNDIWSLGVILVNLTCGRNPWKRACLDDSTFKAFMRDRNFLRTILPISNDLNFILQRIFEVDPRRRITLPELRDLIVCCPSLTQGSSSAGVLTPPYSPEVKSVESPATSVDAMDVPPMDPLPAMQYPPTSGIACSPGEPSACHNLPTPPNSTPCSPQLTPYTFAAKPNQACHPFLAQPAYIPHIPAWSRCGPFVPTFNMPRSACFWNSVPVY